MTEAPRPERRAWLRTSLFGLLAGALLAAMHAPPGLSWTELASPRPWTLASFAAAPWLALAALLHPARWAFRRGISATGLALSGLVGFVLWGGVIATRFRPESRPAFALLFVAASVLLWILAGRRSVGEAEAPREPWLARVGLVLGAAGASLSLANLLQHVRLFGLGLPEDRVLAAAVLIALVALGAVSFGGLLARPGLARPVLGVGLVASAAATLFGLAFLQKMDGDALFTYLRRFGLDLSMVGMLPTTALLAAAALVLPGLLLGTALRGASDAGRLSRLAVGAALGTVFSLFVPELLSGGFKPPGLARWTWDVAIAGTGLSCLGALAFLSVERGRARLAGMFLAVLVAAVPATRPRFGFTRFTPWYPAPIEPDIVMPTPLGVLTVEPYVDGSRIVTLDRKRVTPIVSEERVDEFRILRALGVMRPVEGRAIRLLVIGQLTPARSDFLKVLGPLDVDYTAPWASAFPAIEDLLFPLDAPPIGRPISPAEAESRIADGTYDLVLALPVHGPSIAPKSQAWIPWGSVEEPVLGSLDVPEETTAVAWLDANSPLVRCELGERVLYVAHRFQRPTLGIVRGAIREEATPERPALLNGGSPEARLEAWELLAILPRERAFALHAPLFARLGRANASGPEAELARGLAAHYAVQSVSSPFESAGQQIEFDEQEVRAFAAAGTEEVLDATTRDVLEDEAWLLTEKRRPDLVLAYLESLAHTHGPWAALDRALAHALEELLEPAEALSYYDRVLESESERGAYDLVEFLRAADLAIEVGDYARAIDYARRGIAIQSRTDLQMRLCKALRLFGDPAGDELLEKLRPDLTEEELRWIEGSIGPEPAEEPVPSDEEPVEEPD